MRHLIKKFARENSGQFAVWMALLAIPLVGATTFVLDYGVAQRTKIDLASALDAAALAAILNQQLSDSEREKFAKSHFEVNFPEADLFNLYVKNSSAEKVELFAEGEVPVSVSGVLGFNGIHVEGKSASVITKKNIVCILTLNPDGQESFSLTRGAVFDSPNCSVQVNSIHKTAAFVDGTSRALAKDFCVVGGASGFFSPYVNTECSVISDPYSDVIPPALGPCINLKAHQKGKTARIGDDVVLYPGTYCANIKISGKNVKLMPGIYILENSELWVNQASQVRADGVTFVLKGADSVFYIEQGSDFYLKAPASGPTAGLAIFQDANSALKGTSKRPTATSELSGGSNMVIVGTVYLPTQGISIFGQSSYGSSAPATSYIGYDVSFSGNSKITLNVDHSTAGLPPILPRSDEGARLIE